MLVDERPGRERVCEGLCAPRGDDRLDDRGLAKHVFTTSVVFIVNFFGDLPHKLFKFPLAESTL